jgi:aquaporin Z
VRQAVRRHWPEYLMEAIGLASFMVSACVFATLLEYPGSFVYRAISIPDLRRLIMGLAMGLTAVAIIYSPWGKQSGAHINPAVTLAFLRLGKIDPWDGAFYVFAQFLGGIAGVFLSAVMLGARLADAHVNYVATVPGIGGPGLAFVAEALISFILMVTVLAVSNSTRWSRYTGLCAGVLVATYIALEAPISGMSMNPARTFGSALAAQTWTTLWVYFTAPPLGMLLAAEAYVRRKGVLGVRCAKLHHDNEKRCIFRCGYRSAEGTLSASTRPSAGAVAHPNNGHGHTLVTATETETLSREET